MQTPLVSIIIPTYNRASLIGETLDSVLAQTYTNWECIVVDDRSTDNSIEVLMGYTSKDQRFSYYQRPESRKSGGNAARNYGFEMSKGTYIKWFDSDDIMESNLLIKQINSIRNLNASFSLCTYNLKNEITQEERRVKPIKIQTDIYIDYITTRLKANLQTLLFTRQAVEKFQFNEDLLKFQEYEFLQRFFRHHKDDGVFINEPLVKIIGHLQSITGENSPQKMASALLAILITNSELPKNISHEVKNEMAKIYLRTLYDVYVERMSKVYFKFLIKIIHFNRVKGFVALCYLGPLYVLKQIFSINDWHFKKIYKLY